MANQPIFILPEGTERYSKRDALRMNITAAKVLKDIVRTTLGPKGMDKMLTDSLGDVIVTNDGATIMREMDITQPAARMLVETAKKQEDIVGDGTTSVVVIAGELLVKAQELLEDGIATSVIVKGYRNAAAKSIEILNNVAMDADDRETLKKVAMTAMTGKGSDYAKDKLADLVVDAALRIAEDGEIDIDNINIQRISGDSVEDSFLAEGIVMDKDPVSKNMPTDVSDLIEPKSKKIPGVGYVSPETDDPVVVATVENIESVGVIAGAMIGAALGNKNVYLVKRGTNCNVLPGSVIFSATAFMNGNVIDLAVPFENKTRILR